MQDFAKRLKKLRAEKGEMQDVFASAMGVTPQAVSKWETGVSQT